MSRSTRVTVPAAQLGAHFATLPKAVRRRFLLMLAPWIVVVVVGFPWLWNEMDNAARAPLLRSRESILFETLDILQRTVNSMRQDIILLGDLATPLPSDSEAARQLFMTFAKSAGAYDQVRWLDAQGQERLRVNTRASEPQWVPATELQNQAERPYFRHGIELPEGTIYLSQLDLNTEQGVVERPLEPTMRITTPIYQGATAQGIVAINYRAMRLLDRLANLGHRQGLNVYLANSAGYWLQAPDKEDNWAWQLGQPERTVAHSHPALWQAVAVAPQGRFSDSTGDWAFARFQPEGSGPPTDEERKRMVSDLDLRVLVQIAPERVMEAGWRARLVLLAVLACVLYFGLRLTWHALQTLIEEDRQSRELRAANTALQQANENLRTVQADLARAERLSSLGLMVAGVAHELNTPLGSAGLSLSTVQQLVRSLQDQLSSGLRKSDLERFLTQARTALELSDTSIRRAAGIVQRFKQVAVDRTTLERRSFDLAEIILDSDPRLRRWDAHHPITLRLDLQPGVAMNSYPGPLEQVISNLLGNALAHAFQGRNHGQLALQAAADGPDHVTIRVSDDGMGIAPENRSRIFDPFFTTNRHGGGTGLGLHICFQLVTEMLGGRITLEGPSDGMGSGATFLIRLPRQAPRHAS